MLDVNAIDGLIEKVEKRRLVWLLAASLLATTLPYLWAAAIAPRGFVYSGLLFSPDDQNVHLMWARQAAQGHLIRARFVYHRTSHNRRKTTFQ